MVDFTKPVTTESGCPVKIFTTEARGTCFSVRGEYFEDGVWYQGSWTKDGYYLSSKTINPLNLINVPEEIEGWLNVYPECGGESISAIRSSKSEADRMRMSDRNPIACIKVKFKKGEGL